MLTSVKSLDNSWLLIGHLFQTERETIYRCLDPKLNVDIEHHNDLLFKNH